MKTEQKKTETEKAKVLKKKKPKTYINKWGYTYTM